MTRVTLLSVVWAAVVVALSEAVHRGSFVRAVSWAARRAGDFLLNTTLVTVLCVLFTSATGSFFIGSCVTAVLSLTLALTSFFKFAARNEPLFFSDVFLAFKILGVAGTSNILITRAAAVSFIVAAAAQTGLWFAGPLALSGWERIWSGLVSLAALAAVNVKKSDDFTYLRKGFLRGFFLNVSLYFQKTPTPCIATAVKTLEAPPPNHRKGCALDPNVNHSGFNGARRPNVIAVLSESFFDITRVGNLRLDRDPLPFYHSLRNRAVTGTLLVTPFGGGTCAVESEFLTGAAARYFNISKPFYYSVAKKPIPSMASMFKAHGYETRAVHTFSKYFYNRAQAFANMGFDSFIGTEDMPGAVKDGLYISDAVLTDYIIKAYDNKKGGAFIFAASMENHQPYLPDKYPAVNVSVLNEGLDEKVRKEAETYIHCLTHADREIRRLTDYVDSRPEPTVLLYFGDHLGAIGPKLDFYKKMGYINNDVVHDKLALYSPDFFILSNTGALSGRYDYLGANFLGKLLLDVCGGPKEGLFGVLDGIFGSVRCLSRDDLFIDGEGAAIPDLTGGALLADETLRAACYRVMGQKTKKG